MADETITIEITENNVLFSDLPSEFIEMLFDLTSIEEAIDTIRKCRATNTGFAQPK